MNNVLEKDLVSGVVDLADSGNLIAASAGNVLRVYRLVLVALAAQTLVIKSGSTALTGDMTLAAGVPLVLDFDGYPWFTTVAGEALVATLGAATALSGRIFYTVGK